MLRLRAAELEKRLLQDGQTLPAGARTAPSLIESETTMPITDVELKNVAPQRVLVLHHARKRRTQHVEPLF